VKSNFTTGSIPLAIGNNYILFETFDGNRKVGEDTILVARQDRTPPTVTVQHPRPGASDFATNHPVMVIFSEAMNPDSLNSERFSLTDASGSPVYGELRYDERHFTWMLRPDFPLTSGESYFVRVSGDVEDIAGGNPLNESVSWSFIAADGEDSVQPTFDRRWPGPSCDCAPTDTRILTHFDEPIDPATVDDAMITVRDEHDQAVPGKTLYAGNYLEFVPDNELSPGEAYRVSAANGIEDLVAHPLVGTVAWQFVIDSKQPSGTWADMADSGQVPAMAHHTAVWAEPAVIFWDGAGGATYHTALDTWSPLTTPNAPSPRREHSATWTGTEMIIWGGHADGVALNTGGRYNPASDRWQRIHSPLPSDYSATYKHMAIWTGGELIVWGGYATSESDNTAYLVNQGFRYDPFYDSWNALPTSGAPSARYDAILAWTGAELIIWSGKDEEGNVLDDGARYHPATDTWTPMSQQGAPQSHGHAEAGVWTGSELIAWNGGATVPDQRINNSFREPTLHLYDPVTDRWRRSNSGWEPFPITWSWSNDPWGITAHWTGDRLFILPGWSFAGAWSYDPQTDSWQQSTSTGGRFGYHGKAELWAGDRLIQWGGINNVMPTDDGKVFVP
jgi:hypothetical protein